MSMHNFSGTGPIMAGLAAMSELLEAGPVSNVEGGLTSATFALSADELLRMIENVADQLSEVAAQLVDMRRRIDALDQKQMTFLDGSVQAGIADERVFGTFNGA